MARTKFLSIKDAKAYQVDLSQFPNFFRNGSITGMKNLYYGKDALLVRSGNFIYNVTSQPWIYHDIAK